MEHYTRPGSSILVACGVNSTTIQSGLVGLYYSSNRHMRANYGVQPKPVQVHIWMMTVPKTIKSEFLLLAFAPPYLGSCWSCRRLEFTLGPWFSFLDFSPDNSSCLTQSHTHTRSLNTNPILHLHAVCSGGRLEECQVHIRVLCQGHRWKWDFSWEIQVRYNFGLCYN